jgi:predicted SAM-dependent methyltransferase
VAIKDLNKKQREQNISVDLGHLDAKQGIPFSNNFFDAMYAHIFFNMRFTDNELKFLFSESSRVLKNYGLLYFSVRNDEDYLYNKGKKIGIDIHEIPGFQIRYFTKS